MILVCGVPTESPIAMAIEAADRLGFPHVVYHQRDSRGAELTLSLSDDGLEGTLRSRGRRYDLSQFSGVYTRLLHPSQLPEHRTPSARLADDRGLRRALAACDLLEQWTQTAPCRVANRPKAALSNASKPFQAQVIARAGFPIPPTLVTNLRDALAPFEASHGRLVYKSTSGERSIVEELTAETRQGLPRLRALPTQFQKLVEGDDIRVHVVGERVFATRIRSTATDYRYAGRRGAEAILSPAVLPVEIELRCIALARALDLPFCGIDLRRTPAGEFYCFEVNPSPAYSYYEQSTGQPIANALVAWLAGRDNHHA